MLSRSSLIAFILMKPHVSVILIEFVLIIFLPEFRISSEVVLQALLKLDKSKLRSFIQSILHDPGLLLILEVYT